MRKSIKICVFAGLILAANGIVRADIMSVEATVRDFSPSSHPDFEAGNIFEDTGFVGTTIGSDRKPVYVGPVGGTLTTSGPTNFNLWYNDVPGINLSTTITVDFDNGMVGKGGIYRFFDSDFFPIDGMLFGDEGNPHNYHFTVELHTQFQYQVGQTFTYESDDDLFVFIDDKLVVDHGGVLPARTTSLNLDSLGLTPGRIYSYDIFFAERQSTGSVLSIDTAVVPVPGASLLGILGLSAVGIKLRRHA